MKQYINKAAVVAELENRREAISGVCQGYISDKKMAAEYILLNELLDFLDTLEVKEVDLEDELNKWRHNHFHGRRDKDASGEYLEISSHEAPEKIYLFKNPITETPDDRWLSKRSDDKDIEYTRTDVFIEKACEFIVGNMKCSGYTTQTKAKFIKEFKDYLKGE